MLWQQATVLARADGHTTQAQIAECPDCECRLFMVYAVGPRQLLHYQCGDCTATFCDGHSCSEESEESPPKLEPQRCCRICGCTDDDCRQYIARTGMLCYWVEQDLCSACVVSPPHIPVYEREG